MRSFCISYYTALYLNGKVVLEAVVFHFKIKTLNISLLFPPPPFFFFFSKENFQKKKKKEKKNFFGLFFEVMTKRVGHNKRLCVAVCEERKEYSRKKRRRRQQREREREREREKLWVFFF